MLYHDCCCKSNRCTCASFGRSLTIRYLLQDLGATAGATGLASDLKPRAQEVALHGVTSTLVSESSGLSYISEDAVQLQACSRSCRPQLPPVLTLTLSVTAKPECALH